MKHESVRTETFSDNGSVITITMLGERSGSVTLKIAGSGRTAQEISHMDLAALEGIVVAANKFLADRKEAQLTAARPDPDLPAGVVNYGQPG
jgi:hypothetical protein